MERLLFSKLPVWLILFLSIFALVGVIVFGAAVTDETRSREHHEVRAGYSWVGDLSYDLATVPETWNTLLGGEGALHASQYKRFGDNVGWVSHAQEEVSGYLLFSRIDATKGYTVAELIDL